MRSSVLSVDGSILPALIACSTPNQTVGTAADTVTPASWTSCDTLAGSMCRPVIATDEPASSAPYGVPQAFAWNCGTIGRHTSCSWRPM
jgi:hypothetical protein